MEDGHDLKKGIQLQHVCKQFGQNMVVNNLNLDIYKNQITVLLGQNGAGKSTTMSMITGNINVFFTFIKKTLFALILDLFRNDRNWCWAYLCKWFKY